jgi:hypothetical protein
VRLFVPLTEEEGRRLSELASTHRRMAREEAGWLLARAIARAHRGQQKAIPTARKVAADAARDE